MKKGEGLSIFGGRTEKRAARKELSQCFDKTEEVNKRVPFLFLIPSAVAISFADCNNKTEFLPRAFFFFFFCGSFYSAHLHMI